jgi:hypothetical protein
VVGGEGSGKMERPPPPMQPDGRRSDGKPRLAAVVGECVLVALIVLVLGLMLMPVHSQPPPPRVLSVGRFAVTCSESELWAAVVVAAALIVPCLLLLARFAMGRIRTSRGRPPRDL